MQDIKEKQVYFFVLCTATFAKEKNISLVYAFNYLCEYKGMDFLIDCYDAEHTLSINDVVDDITLVCKNNGGSIE